MNEAVCCSFETDIVDYFSMSKYGHGRCAVYELHSPRTATSASPAELTPQEMQYKRGFLDFVHHRFAQCEKRLTLYLQEWGQCQAERVVEELQVQVRRAAISGSLRVVCVCVRARMWTDAVCSCTRLH